MVLITNQQKNSLLLSL